MTSYTGSIAGLIFSFSSQDSRLVQTVSSLVGDSLSSDEPPVLTVEVLDQTHHSVRTKGKYTIGSGISSDGDGTVYYRDSYGWTRVVRTSSGLHVTASLHDRIDRRLRRRLPRHDHIYSQFHQVVARRLVYQPAQLLLRERRGLHAAHASAVSIDGSGVAIFALNAVGKTSLALQAAEGGALLISDNYILHDKEKMYRFPESLRVATPPSSTIAAPIPFLSLNRRNAYRVNSSARCDSAKIEHAIILERGPKTTQQVVATNDFAARVEAQSATLGELIETSWLAAASRELGFETPSFADRSTALEAALKDARCTVLRIAETSDGIPPFINLEALND